MCAIASIYNLQVYQMGVKIVFLYGDREIYINQPKGYIVLKVMSIKYVNWTDHYMSLTKYLDNSIRKLKFLVLKIVK